MPLLTAKLALEVGKLSTKIYRAIKAAVFVPIFNYRSRNYSPRFINIYHVRET